MATPTHQRVGIWIIVIVMAVGGIGVYFVAILANNNDQAKEAADQKAYQTQLAEYQKQQEACPPGLVAEKKMSPAPTAPSIAATSTIAELRTEDVQVGDGKVVAAGDCVEIFYHGVLAKDAKAFQGGDNYADGTPYRSLTTGFVPGFAQGLVGMKVGGERLVFIPSALGYGAQSQGEIPANADLIFAIRVVGIYTK